MPTFRAFNFRALDVEMAFLKSFPKKLFCCRWSLSLTLRNSAIKESQLQIMFIQKDKLKIHSSKYVFQLTTALLCLSSLMVIYKTKRELILWTLLWENDILDWIPSGWNCFPQIHKTPCHWSYLYSEYRHFLS